MKDNQGRTIDYLRISITDRCNLRCTYCMPEQGVEVKAHEDILRFEELTRLAVVAGTLGFCHFRVTGGEPLARLGVADFVAALAAQMPTADLSLTTNATLLGPLAAELRAAGLRRVNISLDTLQPAKYASITRRDLWPAAWQGIEAALAVGFAPVKINTVLVRGVNDDEILAFGALTKDAPLHVRFIELMPLGEGCHISGAMVPGDEVLATLAAAGELEHLDGRHAPAGAGPAQVYRWRGGAGTIGIIPAISHSFCTDCNRLRLTADGKLHPCLAADTQVDVRGPLRAGASDQELSELFQHAIALKPKCHHMADISEAPATTRRMYKIGG